MPGYILHLAESSVLLDKMRKENLVQWSPAQEEQFFYGSLLPDSMIRERKFISHFWPVSPCQGLVRTPDLGSFAQKYGDKLKNYQDHPLLLGYWAHLHLDLLYFGTYMKSLLTAYDETGNSADLTGPIQQIRINRTGEKVSVLQFFSEDYLYGDYTWMNNEIIRRFGLTIPTDSTCILQEKIEEIQHGDMDMVVRNLNQFCQECTQLEQGNTRSETSSQRNMADYIQQHLKVFELENLLSFIQEAAEQALKWITRDVSF